MYLLTFSRSSILRLISLFLVIDIFYHFKYLPVQRVSFMQTFSLSSVFLVVEYFFYNIILVFDRFHYYSSDSITLIIDSRTCSFNDRTYNIDYRTYSIYYIIYYSRFYRTFITEYRLDF